MAAIAYPSWAFNSAGQPAQLVANVAAFNALGGAGTWAFTPYATATVTAPTDPTLPTTDIRLQQMLIEQRVTNQLLQIGFGMSDDPATQIRPDIQVNDVSLTT